MVYVMFGNWSTYNEWRDEQEQRETLRASFLLLDRVIEVAEAIDTDVVDLSLDEYLTYRRDNHLELSLPTLSLIGLYSRACTWALIIKLATVYPLAESLCNGHYQYATHSLTDRYRLVSDASATFSGSVNSEYGLATSSGVILLPDGGRVSN